MPAEAEELLQPVGTRSRARCAGLALPERGAGNTPSTPSSLHPDPIPRPWGSVPAPLTPFSPADEDDVHKCGRCLSEFSSLQEFVQHKLQKGCKRPPDALAGLLGQEGQKVTAASPSRGWI